MDRNVASAPAGFSPNGASAQTLQARMTYACESCRTAKVKCTASRQPGICRRCLESKRECVFKTGPRTRRPRLSKQTAASVRPPPPPGPSKTFTIDVPLPRDEEPSDPLAQLRDSHEAFLERLMPSPTTDGGFFFDDDGAGGGDGNTPCSTTCSNGTGNSTVFSSGGFSSSTGTSASVTNDKDSPPQQQSPPSPSPASTFSHGLRRPQFNLDSAQALLDSFRRGMDPYFPVAAISEHDTVPALACSRPFVLLAVLAASSGARVSLRGGRGSLYDEEFRKILGLKVVAGGERNVELLVGLLVYCAWYPIHLRPKSKQSSQYLRMAVDMLQDMELDQPEGFANAGFTGEQRLQAIRAYLCCYYLVVARAMAYIIRAPTLPFTAWTATCCDILEREGTQRSDRVLPWLVRNQHLIDETTSLTRAQEKGQRSQYQVDAMLKGLEAQFREWRSKIPSDVAKTPVMTISSLTTEIYLYSSPLWKLSGMRGPPDPHQDPKRIKQALPALRSFLQYLAKITSSSKKASSPQQQQQLQQRLQQLQLEQQQNPFSYPVPPSADSPPAAAAAAAMAAVLTAAAEEETGGEEEFANFSNVDWGRVVSAVVLSFRLSFDMPSCPGWDSARARRELDLGRFLDEVCGGPGSLYDYCDEEEERQRQARNGGASSAENSSAPVLLPGPGDIGQQMNVVCATKIVFRVVKRKFDRRTEQLPPAEAMPPPPSSSGPHGTMMVEDSAGGGFFAGGHHHAFGRPAGAGPATTSGMRVTLDKSMRGCPMLDGSLEPYFPVWGETAGRGGIAAGIVAGGSSSPGDDIVAAMAAEQAMSDSSPIMDFLGGDGGADGSIMMNDVDNAHSAMFQDLWATMTSGWPQDAGNEMTF